MPVKTLKNDDAKVSTWRLAEYVRLIMEQPPVGDGVSSDPREIPYCHDIPLPGLVESLARDCQPFPANFLSPWYRRHCWRYSQFFMGPAGPLLRSTSTAYLAMISSSRSTARSRSRSCLRVKLRIVGAAVEGGLMWTPSNRTMCAFRSTGKSP